MLEKRRNRIKRVARRKFLRKNPKWEENLRRSKQVAELRRHVNETRFRGIFPKREKAGIFKALFTKIKTKFQRKIRRSVERRMKNEIYVEGGNAMV